MTERLVVHNRTELEKYKQVILDNLLESVRVIGELIRDSSALEVFKRFKFDKIAIEPLTGQVENLIEVVNQSQTYLVLYGEAYRIKDRQLTQLCKDGECIVL